MNIITGYTGTPHITSAQDRAIHQGAFGINSYILKVGQKLEAQIVTANDIRINDGILVHQGCAANIEQGSYDTLEISNGAQGMFRTDLIVARYTKDAGTNIESIKLVVIEGTASAGTPVAPAYNEGDIQAGDSPVDMPLYQVNIDGVAIDSVTLVAPVLESMSSMASTLDTLLDTVSDSGTASNTYADVAYSYTKVGKVVTMTYSCTPKSAISGSTGGIDLPGVPNPVGDIYGSTHTNTSSGTVYGPGRLIPGATPQIALYGARTSGTAYHGSFTYLTA